jgi:hypothetical protein
LPGPTPSPIPDTSEPLNDSSSSPKTDPAMKLPVTVGAMKQELRKNEIFTVASAVLVGLVALLGGLGGAVLFVESKASAAGREAAEIVAKDQVALRLEMKAHKDATDASISGTKQEMFEVRTDIRALYNYQLTGARQSRLELPLDGGH